MVNNVRMARELGYLKVPDGILMNVGEMRKHSDSRTVVISTGAQGEPTAALTRMANGSHRHVTINEDDTVVLSSSPIPGNEPQVYRNIDNLFRAGANVIYSQIAPVHVRGHAAREELKIVQRLVQPKYFLGIHGEHRHLVKHRELAIELGVDADNAFVLSDGDVLEIQSDGAEVSLGEVEAGYVYVDGGQIGDVDHIVLDERQKLASDGMLIVVVVIDLKQKKLVKKPEIVSSGFRGQERYPIDVSPDDFDEEIQDLVANLIAGEGERLNWSSLRETLKDEVARHLYRATGRRPFVLPVTVEV